MNYVDGFVASVPKANKQKYIDHATKAAKLFKANGAISVVETWGDNVPEGTLTSFSMAVKCQEDEVVVFSWITWPSKEVHAAAWEKIMQDNSLGDMPFDGKRMIYGSFQQIV
jgi:uncharacterized protein YbaA (DUF1428 family)